MIRQYLALALFSGICLAAHADDPQPAATPAEALRPKVLKINRIIPIYSQLVKVASPKGFAIKAREETKGNHYIHEAVLEGETVHRWTQMITITGFKGLASNAKVTPRLFASGMAAGFKKACPETFSGASFGELKISGHDAFAVILSCGTAKPGNEAYGEAALVLVIRGAQDYYTIQWAERDAASATPVRLEQDKWIGRLKNLMPIRLCPIVPGESPPYPSCSS